MIKPVDIQEKQFTKAMRGYREEEVDKFLDDITIDYGRIIDELRHTQEENSRLVAELEKYKASESTMLETLQTAKVLMADISTSADKRAEILVKNAELDAQLIVKEAQETADRLNEESEKLKARYVDFRTKYVRLLQGELQRFESLSGELFPELGVDDFDDLPDSDSEFKSADGIDSIKETMPDALNGTVKFGNKADTQKLYQTVRNIKY